jgi:hypothetical protein
MYLLTLCCRGFNAQPRVATCSCCVFVGIGYVVDKISDAMHTQQVPLLSHVLPDEQQLLQQAIAAAKCGNKPWKLLPSCVVLRALTAKAQQIQLHRSERLAAYKQQKRAAALQNSAATRLHRLQ